MPEVKASRQQAKVTFKATVEPAQPIVLPSDTEIVNMLLGTGGTTAASSVPAGELTPNGKPSQARRIVDATRAKLTGVTFSGPFLIEVGPKTKMSDVRFTDGAIQVATIRRGGFTYDPKKLLLPPPPAVEALGALIKTSSLAGLADAAQTLRQQLQSGIVTAQKSYSGPGIRALCRGRCWTPSSNRAFIGP